MTLDSGKYHGTELTEVPTEYLEWAVGHLTMGPEVQQAVVAEIARRQHAERVDAETPAQRAIERVSEAVTKTAAKHGL